MPSPTKVAALRAASKQVTVTGIGPYRITGPAHCAPDGIEGEGITDTYLEAVRAGTSAVPLWNRREAITTSYREAMRTAARWRALVALDVLGRLTPESRQAVEVSTETAAHRLLDVGMGG